MARAGAIEVGIVMASVIPGNSGRTDRLRRESGSPAARNIRCMMYASMAATWGVLRIDIAPPSIMMHIVPETTAVFLDAPMFVGDSSEIVI